MAKEIWRRVRPLQDYAVVIQDKIKQSKGGIILPDESQKRAATGTVVAIGPGVWVDGHFRETKVKPGQRVIFGQFDGMEVSLDTHQEEEFLLIREECLRAEVDLKKEG